MRASRARRIRADAAPALDTTVVAEQRTLAVTRRAVGPVPVPAAPPAEMRRRVANLAAGTYVDDILAEQDSTLFRWPERLSDAVRVYVEPSSDVAGWDPRLPDLTRAVFDEWSLAELPLRFTFVYDSSNADLAIRWIERFPAVDGQRIGVTERVQTRDFLIVHATIFVANHDSAGRALPATVVEGIVRHEVGHALGLNHSRDRTSVMYREAATLTLSTSDRATLRLLYLVPPGTLKN